ncbi:MAG: hypothetical protein US50_C0001G0013 [Candidatus Nomurabacteria bacterium GW2011_GWB1_37_5]|uniref:Uncharacterized protein n=1 Tax=Candidatus Nomurabacteria bacterium GW2011_GWB1_37_5 TaxID=1618742 RepID=A0A0G0K5T3_9BACT|nr:MAG: hypothetical protein US50_C0001G0013 [Candidatus Nomurabacteria bacterium GW2011_GWB1_37_5]
MDSTDTQKEKLAQAEKAPGVALGMAPSAQVKKIENAEEYKNLITETEKKIEQKSEGLISDTQARFSKRTTYLNPSAQKITEGNNLLNQYAEKTRTAQKGFKEKLGRYITMLGFVAVISGQVSKAAAEAPEKDIPSAGKQIEHAGAFKSSGGEEGGSALNIGSALEGGGGEPEEEDITKEVEKRLGLSLSTPEESKSDISTESGEGFSVDSTLKEIGDRHDSAFGEKFGDHAKPSDYIKGLEQGEVERLQEILQKAGYDINVDDKWGMKTSDAWKDYVEKVKSGQMKAVEEDVVDNDLIKKVSEVSDEFKAEKVAKDVKIEMEQSIHKGERKIPTQWPNIKIISEQDEQGNFIPKSFENKYGARRAYIPSGTNIDESFQYEKPLPATASQPSIN